MGQGERREAYACFKESLSLAEEINDKLGSIRVLRNMGQVCLNLGEYKEATHWLSSGLELSREYGDKVETAELLVNLAPAAIVQGDYEWAKEILLETIPLLKETGQKSILASSYGNLGMLAEYREDYKVAKEYFQQALALQKESGYLYHIGLTLNNLAVVEVGQGQNNEAEHYNEECKSYFEKLDVPFGLGLYMDMAGSIALGRNDLKLAKIKKLEALKLFRQINEQHHYLTIFLDLAVLAFKESNSKGQTASALVNSVPPLVQSAVFVGVLTNLITVMDAHLRIADQKILVEVTNKIREILAPHFFEQFLEEGKKCRLIEPWIMPRIIWSIRCRVIHRPTNIASAQILNNKKSRQEDHTT